MAATTHEQDQRGWPASAKRPNDEIDPTAAPQLLRNALYLNTDTGACQEAACLAGVAATDWTWAVRLEDLDNDGRLDLFVTNGMNRDLTPRHDRAVARAADKAATHPVLRDSPSRPTTTSRSATWATSLRERERCLGLDQKGALSAPHSGTSTGTATWTSSTLTIKRGSRSCATNTTPGTG